jgi:hypothetical protein
MTKVINNPSDLVEINLGEGYPDCDDCHGTGHACPECLDKPDPKCDVCAGGIEFSSCYGCYQRASFEADTQFAIRNALLAIHGAVVTDDTDTSCCIKLNGFNVRIESTDEGYRVTGGLDGGTVFDHVVARDIPDVVVDEVMERTQKLLGLVE